MGYSGNNCTENTDQFSQSSYWYMLFIHSKFYWRRGAHGYVGGNGWLATPILELSNLKHPTVKAKFGHIGTHQIKLYHFVICIQTTPLKHINRRGFMHLHQSQICWHFFYIFSARPVQTTTKSSKNRFHKDGCDERPFSPTHNLRGGKNPNQGKIHGVTHLSESEKKLKVIDMRLPFNLYPAWNQPLTLRRRQIVFLVRVSLGEGRLYFFPFWLCLF